MTNRLLLLEATTSTFQELLSYLISLTAAYEILKGKTPPDIDRNISEIGKFGEKLKGDVRKIYSDTGKHFDLLSPSKTASQIRNLASEWKKQQVNLSTAISQIQLLRKTGHRLDDPQLDEILGENLINAFRQLEQLLNYMESIREEDLLSWGVK